MMRLEQLQDSQRQRAILSANLEFEPLSTTLGGVALAAKCPFRYRNPFLFDEKSPAISNGPL